MGHSDRDFDKIWSFIIFQRGLLILCGGISHEWVCVCIWVCIWKQLLMFNLGEIVFTLATNLWFLTLSSKNWVAPNGLPSLPPALQFSDFSHWTNITPQHNYAEYALVSYNFFTSMYRTIYPPQKCLLNLETVRPYGVHCMNFIHPF